MWCLPCSASPDPGVAFTGIIQLGSVLAVLSYFARDLVTIVTGSVKAIQQKDLAAQDFRLLTAICVGTIPVCVLGLLFKSLINDPNSPLRSLTVIGVASMVMGFFLLLARKARLPQTGNGYR